MVARQSRVMGMANHPLLGFILIVITSFLLVLSPYLLWWEEGEERLHLLGNFFLLPLDSLVEGVLVSTFGLTYHLVPCRG